LYAGALASSRSRLSTASSRSFRAGAGPPLLKSTGTSCHMPYQHLCCMTILDDPTTELLTTHKIFDDTPDTRSIRSKAWRGKRRTQEVFNYWTHNELQREKESLSQAQIDDTIDISDNGCRCFPSPRGYSACGWGPQRPWSKEGVLRATLATSMAAAAATVGRSPRRSTVI